MSRVGKNPVAVLPGVSVDIIDTVMTVTGKLGALSLPLSGEVTVAVDDGRVVVAPRTATKRSRAMWGTMRSRINSMMTGVNDGFTVNLELNGVGYRAAVEGGELVLALGYSHPVRYPIPPGVTMQCARPTVISIHGIDKQQVGQIAAEIRAWRPPEPFKGKGVRYAGEQVRRKEGKKK